MEGEEEPDERVCPALISHLAFVSIHRRDEREKNGEGDTIAKQSYSKSGFLLIYREHHCYWAIHKITAFFEALCTANIAMPTLPTFACTYALSALNIKSIVRP